MPRPPVLLGTYKTPRFRRGQIVTCELRGDVRIVALSDGLIQWPLGRAKGVGGKAALVIYGGLLKAIRRESGDAVSYWFGVARSVVAKYRRELGVGSSNEGTHAARVAYGKSKAGMRHVQAMLRKSRDPERRRKIAESRRGKLRPKHVVEAMIRGRLAKGCSEETRRKISAANKARGAWPPAAGKPWSVEELALLKTTLPARDVAEKTERSLVAVRDMRLRLGLSLRER